jgi:hypothetical protein
MNFHHHERNRRWLAVSCVFIVGLGLASRKYPVLFPAVLGKYPGDALWALMVYVIVAFVKPALSCRRLAAIALLISYLDEFSQIYQAPWINSLRSSTIGHLLLGSTFSWWDMCAYTVGIALGLAIDLPLSRRRRIFH